MGSGVLAQSLMQRNLVDEYVLLIHPLVLGSGRRFFFRRQRVRSPVGRHQDDAYGVEIATYGPTSTVTR
jgi:riboflavin biosynthesis pyrimidine reductase